MPRTPGTADVVWLSLGPAVVQGFSRLAYALILPAMRADLGWSYTQAGSLNTANAVGYLVGSLVSFYLIAAVGGRKLFVWSMFATAITLTLSGVLRSFEALLILRFSVGAFGAMATIPGAVLASSLFSGSPGRSATAIAIYYAGGGAGIVLSGVTLPFLFASGASWPTSWIAMGAVSLVVSFLCMWFVAPSASGGGARATATWRKRPYLPIMIGYFLFGLGYVAHITFIIAWMRDHGSSPAAVAVTWGALGLTTVLSTKIWGRPLAAWRGGRPMAASTITLTVGAILPLFSTALPVMIASAILFGSALFTVPASVAAYSRKWLPPQQWGKFVAGFTVVFAVGQIIGPTLTGFLSDATGSLFSGLAFSAGTLVVGALIALFQVDPSGDSHDAASRKPLG
jgi:predicted MFS family arabinose efflux permease